MKLYRKLTLFLFIYVVIFIVFWKFATVFRSDRSSKIFSFQIEKIDKKQLQSCPIPIYIDENKYPKNEKLLNDLKCPYYNEIVTIQKGLVRLLKYNVSCSYECVSWNTDFNYKLSKSLVIQDNDTVPCSYFLVTCFDSVLKKVEKQFIFHPVRSMNIIKESISKSNGTPKHDIIVVGIDSISYSAFKYYLPKTFKAFHADLDGVSFKKFNTRGDGTTVNVQAFLTGTKDTETYETRRRIKGSRPVDDFNWIFYHLKKNGYVTLYSEEMTDYGTFQYRLNGFDKKPTDFYLRTPLIFLERNKFYKDFCVGKQPMHMEYLRFLEQFQQSYHDIPKFAFLFLSTLSHDNNKYISYIDEDLAKYIVDLRMTNSKAFIILYSDHGHRFNSRLTMSGKYEERLPFLGISLPTDQSDLKPILIENSEYLISGLDLHATMEDIIGIYTSSIRSRHMSLLRPLPPDRSCNDIELPPHWCSCLKWNELTQPNSDRKLTRVAQIVIDKISNFTVFDRDLCAPLTLNKIISAYRLDANSAVLQFKKSSDVDGFVPDLTDKVIQTTYLYRLAILATPGNAEFDVTISLNETNFNNDLKLVIDEFQPEDVSRTNKYAPWIKCLDRRSNKNQIISDIRKFCICKDIL